MTKIKIAQFVGTMNCGGTETMLMNIFKQIDKDKFEFYFIETTDSKCWYDDEIIKLGGKIIKIEPLNIKKIHNYIHHLSELFKSEHFDVVHSHVFFHSAFVMKAAKIANIKIRIAHSHSAMRKQDNNFFKVGILRKIILKNSTDIIACSSEAGVYLFGKNFKKKGIVLPNPINVEKINNISTQEIIKLRKKHNLKDEIIIGHVGRLVDIKNHKFIIEIAKQLKQKKVKFKMFFIGDGILKNEIEKKIIDNNLQKEIVMIGNVDNECVYSYMNLFDILLLPSLYEGLPVTLIEAQACGLKSYVSDVVSKEADLELGLLEFLNINDIKIWCDKIEEYKKIRISKQKIIEVINNKKYNSKITVQEYEKLYKR